jgi:hypothetical protein
VKKCAPHWPHCLQADEDACRSKARRTGSPLRLAYFLRNVRVLHKRTVFFLALQNAPAFSPLSCMLSLFVDFRKPNVLSYIRMYRLAVVTAGLHLIDLITVIPRYHTNTIEMLLC